MIKTREEINTLTEDIVREVKDTLSDNVSSIILFGSYARGDYDSESDVDVMIISDADVDSVKGFRKSVHKAASRLSLRNDVEVSMLIRDKKTYEEGLIDYPFYRAIDKEGVRIYG